MNEFAPRAFQIIGISGFVLAFVQISIGWFIGFFCTGLFFMMLKKESKPNKFNFFVGFLCFLYLFYCLFTQVF
ncbi:hypothetical protein P9D64_20215 [Bacillus sonorensis]|uniref:hypothetical protein n=1 Tax=Bacillus sonorensis TaxID=119858 RepID=UPI001F21ABFE|nr:hypothetical protein [Bacillus sonorensis]MCF7619727.1 hypothetical protein [Bacillus sonorensis]MEC1503669.1 hypothetical protein [Bacillus sonorensis]